MCPSESALYVLVVPFAIETWLRRPEQLGEKKQEVRGSRAVTLVLGREHLTDERAEAGSATARGGPEASLMASHEGPQLLPGDQRPCLLGRVVFPSLSFSRFFLPTGTLGGAAGRPPLPLGVLSSCVSCCGWGWGRPCVRHCPCRSCKAC